MVYLCAIAGALSAFLVLGQLFGESSGLPRFDAVEVGSYELALLLPLALAGMVCGWVFHAANKGTLRLSEAMGNRPVAKAVLAGIILAVCGMALPFTMFAGESQAHYLMEGYAAIPAVALIATGFVKCALTPTCLNLGWHGGHFFPVIFSGVSLGYGFALLTGAAPAFCVAACTSALMGAVMRQPIMANAVLPFEGYRGHARGGGNRGSSPSSEGNSARACGRWGVEERVCLLRVCGEIKF